MHQTFTRVPEITEGEMAWERTGAICGAPSENKHRLQQGSRRNRSVAASAGSCGCSVKRYLMCANSLNLMQFDFVG